MASQTNSQKIIDFRSDTLTVPSAEMRRVIAEAIVGDDVFNEDPTVKKLEDYVANLLGKEKGLFVPSGTMSNLLAAFCYGNNAPFSEIIMGDACHTFLYEAGNIASVARVHPRQLVTNPDGSFNLKELKESLQTFSDPHCTQTRAIFLENTHNQKGGRVVPMSYVKEVKKLCDEDNGGVKLHCDGARIWNAAIALRMSLAEVVKPFDSVSVCFSKGLGAPIGSMLLGPKDFILQAKHARKMLGGGMRQVGIIASAAMFAVEKMFDRLQQDHDMAKSLAEGIQKTTKYNVIEPETNIVLWDVGSESREKFLAQCGSQGLALTAMGNAGLVRAIPHSGNTMEEVQRALEIVERISAAQ